MSYKYRNGDDSTPGCFATSSDLSSGGSGGDDMTDGGVGSDLTPPIANTFDKASHVGSPNPVTKPNSSSGYMGTLENQGFKAANRQAVGSVEAAAVNGGKGLVKKIIAAVSGS